MVKTTEQDSTFLHSTGRRATINSLLYQTHKLLLKTAMFIWPVTEEHHLSSLLLTNRWDDCRKALFLLVNQKNTNSCKVLLIGSFLWPSGRCKKRRILAMSSWFPKHSTKSHNRTEQGSVQIELMFNWHHINSLSLKKNPAYFSDSKTNAAWALSSKWPLAQGGVEWHYQAFYRL